MVEDREDYVEVVTVKGTDGTNLVTIALDEDGNIISVMKGKFGTDLKTIAVNTLGELIAVLKGASGVNVGVDADGAITVNMKGIYDATPTTVTLDANGHIIAVMKGDYDGALQTIALDAEHRMIARAIPSISGVVNDYETLTADETSEMLYSTTVPAGKRWRINSIFAVNPNGFSGFIRISKWSSGIIYILDERHDMPEDIGLPWSGELWLLTGEKIQARFYDITIGNTVRLYLNGSVINTV